MNDLTEILKARDRIADLNALADHILRGLFTWTMPADWGVDYGFEMGGFSGPERESHRSYLSAREVLAVLGIEPDDEENDEWPPEELYSYAEGLWSDAGAVLRARGGPKPAPPKPPRPPFADMRSQDGLLVLTIPDELIPFVGTDTTLAAKEVSSLTDMVFAYDCGPGSMHYLSPSFVRASFEILLALWRERKKVHDLLGGNR